MANKELDSVIQIDNESYDITAEKAKRVENALTIRQTGTDGIIFDGSEPKTVEIKTINGQSLIGKGDIEITGGGGGNTDTAEKANKIQVNLKDTNSTAYAAITISTEEPTGGATGDIWFKY